MGAGHLAKFRSSAYHYYMFVWGLKMSLSVKTDKSVYFRNSYMVYAEI